MRGKRIFLMFIVLLQIYIFSLPVNAATDPPLRPDTFTANFPFYDIARNENTITLNWSPSNNADFYILELTTDTNWAGQTMSQQITVKSGTTYTDLRANTASNPSSGTVYRYKVFAATNIEDENGNKTDEFVKSTTFASVVVLTDPAVSTKALSTSDIKITWDDVKYDGQSIDYEIVKFKRGVNVGSEQIRAVDIGNSAKRVNGKLEYIIKNLDKSTEYTFQLKPILNSSLVKFNPHVTVMGATNISALVQRYNESIIKLIWDEYQGSIPASDLYYKVIEVTNEDGQKTYRTISTPQVPYYFIQINPGEEHFYLVEVRKKEDDVKVAESAEVSLKDMVIPATPAMNPLSHSVTNNSITLTWDAHTTVNKARDTAVKYDVWMVTEPDTIDNIRMYYGDNNSGITDNRLGQNLEILSGNTGSHPNFSLVRVGGVDKYRFTINNLRYNSIYYIGVVAKKTYLMQDPQNQNLIISSVYVSEPAMATIKTGSGNLEQPVALVKPDGVSIQTDAQGKAMVTQSTVTIKWPLGEMQGGVFKSYYENDVYFKVGLEQNSSTFDKSKINDTANPDYNMQTQNVSIVRGAQEATATITNLRGNTAYVIWIKAYRDIPDQPIITRVSEASDPIIIVTLPDYTIPNAKPPVPALSIIDNQYQNKVTVQFNSIAGMSYTIQWGKEDSVAKKVGQKEYTATSSLSPDSVVIDGLDPESTYFFWIMASNGDLDSEWSDSVIGRTTPIPPPDVPQGFGVKKVLQGTEWVPDIGEHHIMLQWDKVNNISYIIEVSKKDNFSESEKIEVSEASEYKLDKFKDKELASNTRYWIRIFAKDNETDKISVNSPYLTVKTKFNYDEYDSSQENEKPVEGKITTEVIDGTKGTWNVTISKENGERLIEKARSLNGTEYSLDLSQTSVLGVNKREIVVPYKVLQSLSVLNQSFIVKTGKSEFIFLPNSIDLSEMKKDSKEESLIYLTLQTIAPTFNDSGENYKVLSETSILEVTAKTPIEEKSIIDFKNPIKIKLNYLDDSYEGIINAYAIYPGETQWTKVNSSDQNINAKTYKVFLNSRVGKFAVRKQFPDVKQYGVTYAYKNEIEKLLNETELKSLDKDNIRPRDSITLGDTVKLILDVSKSDYDQNYIEIAKKAGLLSGIKDTTDSRKITRQEAVYILMRLYEVRTGEIIPQTSISSYYSDANEFDTLFRTYSAAAMKMGILKPSGSLIKPNEPITKGEVLAMISRFVDLVKNIEGDRM